MSSFKAMGAFDSLSRLAADPQVQKAAWNTLEDFMLLRIIVTFLIIVWWFTVSSKYIQSESYDAKSKISYVHDIWFGKTSLVSILFYMWVATTVVAVLYKNYARLH